MTKPTEAQQASYHRREKKLARVFDSGKRVDEILDGLTALAEGKFTLAEAPNAIVSGRRKAKLELAKFKIVSAQVDKLVDADAPGFLGVSKRSYRREMMDVIYDAVYRDDLHEIGLRDLALIDPRLVSSFLVRAAGVIVYIANIDDCTPYADTPVLSEPTVIQGQWGQKYRNTRPRTKRDALDVLEQGISVAERLHVHLFDPTAVEVVNSDILGSVTPVGDIPCLCRYNGEAELYSNFSGNADSNYGGGSRGRLVSLGN